MLGKFRSGEIPGYSLEKRHLKADGELIWASNPGRSDSSSRQYLVMVEYITERINNEAKICPRKIDSKAPILYWKATI